MCPFLEEEGNEDFDDYQIDNGRHLRPSKTDNFRSAFLKDDKKFFIIGGAASIVAFCAVMYVMYSNNKPIDLEDLPVIKADTAPIKIKPTNNLQVDHQDKIVYDNISDVKRASVAERTIAQPEEEVLSINETDLDGVLSEEEKKNIIQAFDDLAPEKEYKINYVKNGGNKAAMDKHNSESTARIKIVEDESPPIKRVGPEDNPRNKPLSQSKKHKEKIKDFSAAKKSESYNSKRKKLEAEDEFTPARGGSVMIQVASVPTKSAAEAEFKRIVSRNKILKGAGKKIVKVDLGKSKGITYRIQAGPFKNNAEAQKVVSSLRNNGFFSYISR